MKRFTSILRQFYDFYRNSAVRMAGLHAIQTTLNEKLLKPLEPSSTRWLSLEICVTRLKDTFVSVMLSLDREGEERGDAKAVGLQNLMSSWRFIATMLLMCDLLPHVNKLSRALQASEFEHSTSKPLIASTTISTLAAMKTTDGANLQQLTKFVTGLEQKDINVKKRSDDNDFFRTQIRERYIDMLVNNIALRFPEVDAGVLGLFHVLDPHSLRSSTEPSYGNDAVKQLYHHFLRAENQLNNEEDAVNEWTSFKKYAEDTLLKQTDLKPGVIVDLLCTTRPLQSMFPVITQLARIYRVLPCHTADSERTFSQMKLIKTLPRNRLNQSSLDSLVRIAVDGPPVNSYNYTSAVKVWAEKKHRGIYSK